MRVIVRAYDLDLLRGTGVTVRAVARYLAELGHTVWATNTVVDLDQVRAWKPDAIIGQEWATDEASSWATALGIPFVMLVHGPDEYERWAPQCDLVVFNTELQHQLSRVAIVLGTGRRK